MTIQFLNYSSNLLIRLRYNTSINMTTSSYIDPSKTQSGFGMEILNLDNATKNDNGIEYKIIVTNRFGQNSVIYSFEYFM